MQMIFRIFRMGKCNNISGKNITLAETFYITCWKTLIHLKEVLHLREDIITLVYSVANPDLYRRGCKSRALSVNAVSWYIILW